MSILKFSDGMNIEMSGEYRIIEKSDGHYVVGHNMCIPVNSHEDGSDLIADLEGVERIHSNK